MKFSDLPERTQAGIRRSMAPTTREQAADMADAHADGLHADLPREGCPDCEGRSLRDYPPAIDVAPWGDIKVGDRVTSRGRHGTGQPIVTGRVVEIDGQRVKVAVGDHGTRTRTIRNLRRIS